MARSWPFFVVFDVLGLHRLFFFFIIFSAGFLVFQAVPGFPDFFSGVGGAKPLIAGDLEVLLMILSLPLKQSGSLKRKGVSWDTARNHV